MFDMKTSDKGTAMLYYQFYFQIKYIYTCFVNDFFKLTMKLQNIRKKNIFAYKNNI